MLPLPTSSATGYDSKAWEQVKNFYNVNMSLPKNLVVVNEKTFAALDQPTQAAVIQAAKEAHTANAAPTVPTVTFR